MTKSESEFQFKVRNLGCIACLVAWQLYSPCEIHHILSGGRRIGEDRVLGLCPLHHRGGRASEKFVSRHPYKRLFERCYGTELELLKQTKMLIGV